MPVNSSTYDPLNPATFAPPAAVSAAPGIVIEFCDRVSRCVLHRATWTSTELFLTFPPPAIASIALVPLNAVETAGRFRVWLTMAGSVRPVLVWDRKIEGRFPEMKELKQRVRDRIQPGKSLGHSDR
ncbi:hypothetical protein K488DRAFT_54688 [Vararia minispora EC-137]|uniref:Uncharacterized protein n=1 Tax=Vararia minispora EC-137 TaxID=1314806 RepID=A0ACB8QEW4_9AGAM|nr:hypothetical protein K488DRAFT_54688 [Vararia minispora EC-137]